MKKKAILIAISAILYAVALIIKFENIWINNTLFIISYLLVGAGVLLEAVEHIFKGKLFDENFLMAVATIGAFVIGEYPEAVAVMLFYQIGELFQDYAVDKSKKSISTLMDIRPDKATILRNGKEETINPEEVKIGETIIVKAGEKVPLDGEVIGGSTTLDTKALTGESLPREANIGDEVLSGTVNISGLIKIKVTKKFGESTVSKILDLVENASTKKSKSENFITKFAKYYTPIVVIIALILAVVPPLILSGATFADWVHRALSFLVVSCPCALVISIPLSFFGGIGGASKLGILIKGSNYLELLAKTEAVVFDKTGTLTEGIFEIQKIEAIEIEKEELLELVAYSEAYSTHPIAESVKIAYGREINKTDIEETKEISGHGIKATIKGKKVLVGNEKLMQENNIEYKHIIEVGTILHTAIEGKYAGYIQITDTIKKDAKETIIALKKSGIKQTIMLTGDKKEVGEDVAKKLGIDEVYTELLPDKKVEKVEELKKTKSERGVLVFVGDGINDAPVLALSDIGIAMGALGSDAAIEAADMVIMTDEPSKIISAIKLSKKTMRIVKQNIIFAITVKIAVLLLSAIGISTMWQAVFADVGVSILAIINSLRMLKVKKLVHMPNN